MNTPPGIVPKLTEAQVRGLEVLRAAGKASRRRWAFVHGSNMTRVYGNLKSITSRVGFALCDLGFAEYSLADGFRLTERGDDALTQHMRAALKTNESAIRLHAIGLVLKEPKR